MRLTVALFASNIYCIFSPLFVFSANLKLDKMRIYIYENIQGVPFLKTHLDNSSTKHFQQKCFRQKLYNFKGDIRWSLI